MKTLLLLAVLSLLPVPAHAVRHPRCCGMMSHRHIPTETERAWIERYRLLRRNGYTEKNARRSADRYIKHFKTKGGDQ